MQICLPPQEKDWTAIMKIVDVPVPRNHQGSIRCKSHCVGGPCCRRYPDVCRMEGAAGPMGKLK